MLRLPLVFGLLFVVPASHADDGVDTPRLQAGDAWTFRATLEKGSKVEHSEFDSKVARIVKTSMYVENSHTGSSAPPVEELVSTDWSHSHEVSGKPVLADKPFAFPLAEGKAWDVSYTAAHPNPMYATETWTAHYTVVGWEDIEVPAGKFHALKVEAEGTWSGMTTGKADPSRPVTGPVAPPHEASGRTYRALWYVPSAKRAVKEVFEEFTSKGVMGVRRTTEMEAAHVSN
ncbi:hypothetical protein L2Y96_19550 [Luteibacter aegosomaticola]|uniref:hypothetical protein n=1 Tax=Luteibacter aegosomaticola TaxID=2911538 RepID=UPI001FF93AEA|nr:hypothetical protein [Luteibacter aegosomaticola]UPG89566.1 hypothetical protein L2Y96_19550 [Luteibacter aegosomaticola]